MYYSYHKITNKTELHSLDLKNKIPSYIGAKKYAAFSAVFLALDMPWGLPKYV